MASGLCALRVSAAPRQETATPKCQEHVDVNSLLKLCGHASLSSEQTFAILFAPSAKNGQIACGEEREKLKQNDGMLKDDIWMVQI